MKGNPNSAWKTNQKNQMKNNSESAQDTKVIIK